MRNRRPVLISLSAVAALLLGASAAHAGGLVSAEGSGTRVANLLVDLDSSSPTTGNPCGDDGAPFELVTMSVSVDGDYTFRDAQYQGRFVGGPRFFVQPQASTDPVDCRELRLSVDGDRPRVSLEADVVYVVVLQQSLDQVPGEVGLTATGTTGTSGSVTFGAVVEIDSPTVVGGAEVTGNGTTFATVDYTTDASSPTTRLFSRAGAEICGEEGVLEGESAYESVRMQVSETGSYRFRALYTTGAFDESGYAAIHAGSVRTPGDPGCVEATDSSESVDLEAGTVYTLFLTGDEESSEDTTELGRWAFSVVPNGPFDGRITFTSTKLEVDEAVVCAPGGAVPAGYTLREGTARSETLIGTPGNDLVRGLGGNDTIRGLGGDDILCGGDGQDTLDGGVGEDVLFGGTGQDTLYGGAGDDRMEGGAGNDSLFGQAGADALVGGAGLDVLDGGPGVDSGTDADPRTVFRNLETVNGPTPAPTPTRTTAGR